MFVRRTAGWSLAMKAEFFPWISSFGGVAFETQPLFTERERENVAIARG